MFDVYIDSIVSEYKETLKKQTEINGLSEYIDVFSCAWLFEGIKGKLLSMVARTLINEMYLLKAEGVLRGDTSKQRYLFFDALTKTTARKGETWILCPHCKGKTRIRTRDHTELKNFPLFCPKCRKGVLFVYEKD